MNSNITVSGKIISELSEKIPSNIIALNELIKNSYDAGANKVLIILNSEEKKLTIKDDGCGMNKSDIDTLFHISNSKKKYGVKNEYNRYTQGSKGLGFLSVFKFGEYVVWKTNKDCGLRFSVDYSKLIKSNDITNYNIEVFRDDNINKGTKIEIKISDYNLKSLKQYLSQEKNYEKIISAFLDKDFIIELQIDGKRYSNENKISIKKYLPEKQLYYIKYNSSNGKVEYYYNNILILTFDYELKSNKYKVEIELQIFKLSRGDKAKISKLFYNPQDDLTPLLYINSNLFNNYSIFDPGINKNIKSGSSLNQMIGYIKITSSNNMISFNSDRTQFLQNELTDDIITFLSNINKEIQKYGAKYRKHLVDLDFLLVDSVHRKDINLDNSYLRKIISDKFLFKDKVIIKQEKNRVIYSIFGREISIDIYESPQNENQDNNESANKGKQNDEENAHNKENENDKDGDPKPPNIIPAVIELKNKHIKTYVPSKQIDLIQYIKNSYDSNGKKISNSEISVKVDNSEIKNGILESIKSPCVKNIEYSYLDSNTGLVIERMVIEFFQPKSKVSTNKNNKEALIYLPTQKEYNVNFNYILESLMDEINKLNIMGDFDEVIECSLRALFEISVDSLKKDGKFNNIFNGINKLEERVGKVIEYIKNNRTYISELCKATEIDFNSLKNILNPGDFKVAIEKANLGAHKSSTYMSKNFDKEYVAKKAAIFIVIVNEMINNDKIV